MVVFEKNFNGNPRWWLNGSSEKFFWKYFDVIPFIFPKIQIHCPFRFFLQIPLRISQISFHHQIIRFVIKWKFFIDYLIHCLAAFRTKYSHVIEFETKICHYANLQLLMIFYLLLDTLLLSLSQYLFFICLYGFSRWWLLLLLRFIINFFHFGVFI